MLAELLQGKLPDLPVFRSPAGSPPCLLGSHCLLSRVWLTQLARATIRPIAVSEHLAHRETHIYSPPRPHPGLFSSAKVVQRYIWRREQPFGTWLLVALGCSQGAHVLSPDSKQEPPGAGEEVRGEGRGLG